MCSNNTGLCRIRCADLQPAGPACLLRGLDWKSPHVKCRSLQLLHQAVLVLLPPAAFTAWAGALRAQGSFCIPAQPAPWTAVPLPTSFLSRVFLSGFWLVVGVTLPDHQVGMSVPLWIPFSPLEFQSPVASASSLLCSRCSLWHK